MIPGKQVLFLINYKIPCTKKEVKTNERKVLRFGDILAPLSRETKIKYAIARVLRVQSHLFA